MTNYHVLVIDDDESIIRTFTTYLGMYGYTPHTAMDYDSALDTLAHRQVDVIIADIMLGERSGIEILKEVKSRGLECPVIMITGDPEIDTAAAAVRLGAFDYLTKPISKDAFIQVVKHAIQTKAFQDEKMLIEHEKEEYRAHMEAVFKSVTDAIITVDNQLRVTQVNTAFEQICGISSVVGSTLPHIVNTCSLTCWNVFQNALQTKNYIREYRIECQHAKNMQQVVLLNVTPLIGRHDDQIGGVMVVRDISRLAHLEKELHERNQLHNIIGRNSRMQEIYDLIENLQDMDTTVLITGPSGTGKELIARAVHYSGERAHKPFVVVNCSALSENLLESELFGHVKGSFTGAIKDKVGRFQLANHGTLFLDEIGDISLRVQVKLLRVLESREFERVGDHTPIRMDVRIISATNQDLMAKVRRGEFREDLFYRLKVMEIKVPPLKERRDDIPLLVGHFLEVFNKKFNKQIAGLAKEVETRFMEYDWPGNVRELMHVLEHAYVVCRGQLIELHDLPPEIKEALEPLETAMAHSVRRSTPLGREEILAALEKVAGNKVKAAQLLGVSRQYLYQKLKDFHISD